MNNKRLRFCDLVRAKKAFTFIIVGLVPAVTLASAVLVAGPLMEQDAGPAVGASAFQNARFAEIDQHALRATAVNEKTLDSLAAYLTEGAKNDTEKARSVFSWVVNRLEYDVGGLMNGTLSNKSPADVMLDRKGACGAYAAVFSALATLAGLKSVIVTGYTKGALSARMQSVGRVNHAWNAVQIDGQWRMVDATWAAGYVKGNTFVRKLDNFYFLVPAENLVLSHFSLQDEAGAQKGANLSRDEFLRLPNAPARLMQAGFKGHSVLATARNRSYNRFVSTYDHPLGIFEVIQAPVKYQQTAEPITFSIRSTVFEQIAVLQNGKFTYFEQQAGAFSATFQPMVGTFFIMGRKADSTVFQALLGYEVPASVESPLGMQVVAMGDPKN